MTGGAWRLPQGGLVDRARPVSFSFNGARYQGLEGDSLASALLANGVHFVGRSFKLHRPRGIFGAGFDETGAIVQLVGDEDAPNQLATRVALREGLAARSVNCWPGPRFDLGALAQLAAPLLPAGFYYKTFMWPDWHLFEPLIRKAAGLGRAPRTAPPDAAFESRFGHADIVVVGAGPAGLAAALAVSASAAQVILVDDGDRPGGRLLADGRRLGERPGGEWVESARAELAARGNVRVLQNATAWGYLEHNYLAVLERGPAVYGLMQRNWKIRTRQIILATGAFERPIPFPGSAHHRSAAPARRPGWLADGAIVPASCSPR
jgi:sarcosine oxidase subunit alpha